MTLEVTMNKVSELPLKREWFVAVEWTGDVATGTGEIPRLLAKLENSGSVFENWCWRRQLKLDADALIRSLVELGVAGLRSQEPYVPAQTAMWLVRDGQTVAVVRWQLAAGTDASNA